LFNDTPGRRLELEDLPALSDDDKTLLMTKKLGPKKGDFTMLRILWVLRHNFAITFGTDFLSTITCFISPLCFRYLLQALEKDRDPKGYTPWLFLFGLAVKPTIDTVLKHSALYFSNRWGLSWTILSYEPDF
jgi:hypothetical protein